jgi:hypothetical protein
MFEKGYDDKVIIDSDSSLFSWLLDDDGNPTKVRDPEFPANYMAHIKNQIGKVDFILVSSHIDVRKALNTAGLNWCYVFPRKSLMLEWVGRCWIRGSDKQFIDCLIKNWDQWTSNHWDYAPSAVVWLSSGQYLADRMPFIQDLQFNYIEAPNDNHAKPSA